MKWDEVKDQFYQSAHRLGENVEYITNVGKAFENLVKYLQMKEPNTCIEQINHDASMIGNIFKVEDPENVPEEAVKASSEAIGSAQQFLFTFLRVAALFQNVGATVSIDDFKIPPGSKIH